MFQVTVEMEGVNEQIAKLQRLPADIPRVLDGIGQMLESRISGRFETQRDPLNAIWAKWKPATEKSYPKDGNRKKLNRYGDMLRSLNHQLTDVGAAVQIGFGSPYAVFHEFGTRKMARRGMLFAEPSTRELAPADKAAILDALNDWISGAIK